ncbi:MAG: hypothetical protein V4649_03660 [Bacteroidota bacterium]
MQTWFTRNLLVLCFGMAVSSTAVAQMDAYRVYVEPDGWSIGTNFGLSDLWGDVGTKSFVSHYTNSGYFDRVAFMGGMFGRYTVHPCFGIRFAANIGSVFATDKWNKDLAEVATTQGDDPVQRYLRSQDAKAYMAEGTVLFEFTPRRRNPDGKKAKKPGQPFIGAGLGFFHFTPYSTVGSSGKWVETYNLNLEGQGWGEDYPKQYSRWQPCIPLVIGYRWDIGQHLNLGIEYMYRMTFTDYLDGVSGKYVDPKAFKLHLSEQEAFIAQQVADKQPYFNNDLPNAPGNLRGNKDNNDGYSTLSITLYYKVLTRNRTWWRYGK